MTLVQELKDIVNQATLTGDWSDLNAYTDINCSFTFNLSPPNDSNVFDEKLFEYMVELLSTPTFIADQQCHYIINIIEYDFNLLSSVQRQRVLEVLDTAFEQISDPLGIFLVAEILGEYFCNDNSLCILVRHKDSVSEAVRELVATGLGYIARNDGNKDLASRAQNILNEMLSDSSPEVRVEAGLCLGRAKRK